MIKNKIFSLFITLLLVSSTLKAEEQPDYERLLSGQCTTQDGFFFNEKGMVKLVTNIEEKIELIGLEKQKQIELLKLDLTACQKSKLIELNTQKELFEKQLFIRQQAIDAYKHEIFWGNVKTAGYIVLAVTTGFIIGYLVR